MFEVLSQLSTIDLSVIFWSAMALLALGMALTVRTIAIMRKARERRVLVGLVLDMLERGISPVEISALLRTMGLQHYDEQFSASRRRLFRRYAKRRTAGRTTISQTGSHVACRKLEPDRELEPALSS